MQEDERILRGGSRPAVAVPSSHETDEYLAPSDRQAQYADDEISNYERPTLKSNDFSHSKSSKRMPPARMLEP